MAANDKQVGGRHYQVDPIQHWDLIIANGIPYMEAQVMRYMMRHRMKGGVQDLEKAQHYLEKLLEVERKREAVIQMLGKRGKKR